MISANLLSNLDRTSVAILSSVTPTPGTILTAGAGASASWMPPKPASALAAVGGQIDVSSSPIPKEGQILIAGKQRDAEWKDIPPANSIKCGSSIVTVDSAPSEPDFDS